MNLRGTTRFLCLLAVTLAACGDETEATSETKTVVAKVDGWEIEASAPTVSGGNVSASFTARGEGMRGFGACLLVSLHGGKACTTPDDCETGAVVTPNSTHNYYCIETAGQTQKTCWTRNGEDMAWCNKRPPPGREAGTYMTPAVSAVVPGAGSKTRWMVLSCLNAGTFPTFSDEAPPCASSDPAAVAYRAYSPSPPLETTAP